MRYDDFHVKGESLATTLNRINAYIDKTAILDLHVDRSDEAKARFISNVTRGEIWDYYTKGPIYPTTSYHEVIQELKTRIIDGEELESGWDGPYSRKVTYRRNDHYKKLQNQPKE